MDTKRVNAYHTWEAWSAAKETRERKIRLWEMSEDVMVNLEGFRRYFKHNQMQKDWRAPLNHWCVSTVRVKDIFHRIAPILVFHNGKTKNTPETPAQPTGAESKLGAHTEASAKGESAVGSTYPREPGKN